MDMVDDNGAQASNAPQATIDSVVKDKVTGAGLINDLVSMARTQGKIDYDTLLKQASLGDSPSAAAVKEGLQGYVQGRETMYERWVNSADSGLGYLTETYPDLYRRSTYLAPLLYGAFGMTMISLLDLAMGTAGFGSSALVAAAWGGIGGLVLGAVEEFFYGHKLGSSMARQRAYGREIKELYQSSVGGLDHALAASPASGIEELNQNIEKTL